MISIPNKMIKELSKSIPENLIKQRPGARNMQLSYISGSTVIDFLNSTFGYLWDWIPQREWITESTPYFDKRKNKMIEQGPVAHVMGILKVKIYDEDTKSYMIIEKGAYGSKSIIGNQSEQESIFKAAGTDALKKAATQLGYALDLYRDEEEQEHFEELNNPWTEDMLQEKEAEMSYIASFIEKYDLSEGEFNSLLQENTNDRIKNQNEILPENVDDVVKLLKELDESNSDSEEE